MTTANYIIGVDIGTTSTKAVLFSAKGDVIEQHAIEYPLLSPTADVQEQDPDEIFEAVINSVKTVVDQTQIDLGDLAGASFSAAMHSLIAVDTKGQPLTPSITWADRRSAPWVDKIRQHYDAHALYSRTGTPIHPMSPLVKLVWLRHEQPDLFNQAARFISIKEYVLYRWLGEYVVDYSIANATGLFNMRSLDWDSEALAIAGVSADRLSRLVPTTHVQPLLLEVAATMGLPSNLPVVVGASDGVLANLGVGAIAPGVVAVTVGTSGAVRAVLDQPQVDPQERLFCYALTEQHWVIGGAVNNGGMILRWVRDNLADAEVDTARLLQQDPYDILTAIADTVPPGSKGLIFHPYLAGERSPLWDANARGSFFGLTLHHTKAHLIRSVLEGIVYNLYLVLEALQDIIGPAKSIQATGGFARSTLWRQMLADVFDRAVIVPETYESSCFGAAVLGLYALGLISSLERVSDMIGETYRHRPIPENVCKYRQVLPFYAHLLDHLKGEYAAIAAIQAELEKL
ncbi:MAG: gluconokinase [Leptolyngbyaceae cyanobacterium SM1_1_3]|nr:gluconokinase [Leptolyngbyaceae cyanobacterium SM1_1_3]NJN02736.1 gluconokinase [Leptolyngbyaceae cyanobacterium RM1_1_2]NJO09284.1 gluconokinase [Leptolyngbyaceae cyanobacterium SL_1_1]